MGLLNRVVQTSRSRRSPERSGALPQEDASLRLAALEQQVAQLESLVEGLQDAIHRDSLRVREDLKDLQTRTRPAEMASALSQHARDHGL